MSCSQVSTGLQIGSVALRTGLSVDTIRFYEKQNLISKPVRSQGGFRLYDDASVERLTFVTQAQTLGFSLREIRELLLLRDVGGESCSHVHDLLNHKLTMILRKISELKSLECQLRRAKRRCNQELARKCTRSCPVLDDMARSQTERINAG